MNYVYWQIGWRTNSLDVLDCNLLGNLIFFAKQCKPWFTPMYKSTEQTENKEVAPGSLDSSQRPRNSGFSVSQLWMSLYEGISWNVPLNGLKLQQLTDTAKVTAHNLSHTQSQHSTERIPASEPDKQIWTPYGFNDEDGQCWRSRGEEGLRDGEEKSCQWGLEKRHHVLNITFLGRKEAWLQLTIRSRKSLKKEAELSCGLVPQQMWEGEGPQGRSSKAINC